MTTLVLISALLATTGGSALLASTGGVRIPQDAGEVLEQVPPRSDPQAQAVRVLEAKLRAAPNDANVAADAARSFLALSIEQGDPRWTGRAQSALHPWWDSSAPPEPIRVLRAAIRQHNHDFPAALKDLDQAVKEAPQDAQAWLTRATVLQVRGEYPAARISCGPLVKLARPLVSAACLASVASLSGGARQGEALLTHILAEDDGREPGTKVWALTLLAEIAARRGDAAAADASFKRALAVGPPDAYLLSSYSDFLLDEGRAAEVLPLLGDKTQADALLLRLALAEKATKGKDLAAHVETLRQRFEDSKIRGDTVHRREEAMFRLHLLGDSAAALQLARANWEVQHEPLDARILLEAASAAKSPGEAKPALDFLALNHVEDAQLARLRGQGTR